MKNNQLNNVLSFSIKQHIEDWDTINNELSVIIKNNNRLVHMKYHNVDFNNLNELSSGIEYILDDAVLDITTFNFNNVDYEIHTIRENNELFKTTVLLINKNNGMGYNDIVDKIHINYGENLTVTSTEIDIHDNNIMLAVNAIDITTDKEYSFIHKSDVHMSISEIFKKKFTYIVDGTVNQIIYKDSLYYLLINDIFTISECIGDTYETTGKYRYIYLYRLLDKDVLPKIMQIPIITNSVIPIDIYDASIVNIDDVNKLVAITDNIDHRKLFVFDIENQEKLYE